MVTLIAVMVVVVLVTLLSVQNAMPVLFTVLYWEFQISLAILFVISFMAGILTGAVAVSHFRKRAIENRQTFTLQEKEGIQ